MLKIHSLPELRPVLGGFALNAVENAFIEGYDGLAGHIHQITREKGFWKDGVERNQAEMIALMHSELSEALEALRKDPRAPDKHCPQFSNLEVELADCIVRIMDFGYALGLDVPGALVEKVAVNAGRPHMHGKTF